MAYSCPVCYFPDLVKPPQDYSICPCCGTEFDYDDATTSHAELLWRWIESGAQWHSHVVLPVPGWDAVAQLNAGAFDGRTTISNRLVNETALAGQLFNRAYAFA